MTDKAIRYECPSCNSLNALDGIHQTCVHCGHLVMPVSGIYDLTDPVACRDERAFYDREYAEGTPAQAHPVPLSDLEDLWHRPDSPENAAVLQRLGSLAGKRVLLIGNGTSRKELALLAQHPGVLIYSDLSIEALIETQRVTKTLAHPAQIEFAAVDAMRIPFAPESFDVVYGFAMVHHLAPLDPFLEGVARVLAPNGIAVFMDDGFSPMWQASKRTWLWPLMRFSHWRTGISPEDARCTATGGFREDELAEMIAGVGGVPHFERLSLLTYLVYRASEKLLPAKLDRSLRNPVLARRKPLQFRSTASSSTRIEYGSVCNRIRPASSNRLNR